MCSALVMGCEGRTTLFFLIHVFFFSLGRWQGWYLYVIVLSDWWLTTLDYSVVKMEDYIRVKRVFLVWKQNTCTAQLFFTNDRAFAILFMLSNIFGTIGNVKNICSCEIFFFCFAFILLRQKHCHVKYERRNKNKTIPDHFSDRIIPSERRGL